MKMRITKHKNSNKKLEQVIVTDSESIRFNIHVTEFGYWVGESVGLSDKIILEPAETREEIYENLEEEIELYFNKRKNTKNGKL